MNKIKELRKEKNITVAELAKELGISQSMLTNYENGNGTPRDESIWEKLSQIFVLLKLDLLDSDDMEDVSEFLDKLLSKDKYEGRRATNMEYIAK